MAYLLCTTVYLQILQRCMVISLYNFSHGQVNKVKVFWYPKLICTSNSRAFKIKHFDINLKRIDGLIRKLWVIKYEIWTAAILFSS